MEDDEYAADGDASEEELLEHGEIESNEEAFMRGYAEEDDVNECAECGKAIGRDEKKTIKVIGDEKHLFCSEECAKEYEESIAKDE